MAIIKEIDTLYGDNIKASYWRVEQVLIDLNIGKLRIILKGFDNKHSIKNLSERIYEEDLSLEMIENSPFSTFIYEHENGIVNISKLFINNDIVNPSLVIKSIYELIKNKEEFINSVDDI